MMEFVHLVWRTHEGRSSDGIRVADLALESEGFGIHGDKDREGEWQRSGYER